MAKIGDIVRFLNSVGGGRITKIKDNLAWVEDEDGFETPTLIRECVVVHTAEEMAAAKAKPKENFFASNKNVAVKSVPMTPAQPEAPKAAAMTEPEKPLEIVEVEGADELNVVLGFEATDIANLGASKYEAFLVNDSNYFLYFTLLSRADDEQQWTTRYAGMVEPNIQLLCGVLSPDDVNRFDRLAVQLVAFKNDKPFDLKNPVSVEYNIDTTKFFKVHCFQSNHYFERRALVFEIVKDDVPRSLNRAMVTPEDLERAMNTKKRADSQPQRQQPKKTPASETIEVDLHASELLDNTRGLSNSDILNVQIDKFREVMDANLKRHGQKIVFIHGKGEGVLRQALLKELNYRYKDHRHQDASFRQYGYGATMVIIK